jgi:hypothetical protein
VREQTKSSGWLSPVIWACSVGLVALGALSASPSASAHVSVSPGRATAGSEATLTFSVPNETFTAHADSRIDRVIVVAPRNAKISQAQAKPGWIAVVRGHTAIWRSGSIPYREYDTFGLVVEVPEGKGRLVFHVSERFAVPPGRVDEFPVPFEVGAASERARDTGGTAEAALAVAVATAALLLGVIVFVSLRRWLIAREE